MKAPKKPAPTVGLPRCVLAPDGRLEVDVVLQMLVLVAPVVFLAVIMLLAWVEEVVPEEPPDEVP